MSAPSRAPATIPSSAERVENWIKVPTIIPVSIPAVAIGRRRPARRFGGREVPLRFGPGRAEGQAAWNILPFGSRRISDSGICFAQALHHQFAMLVGFRHRGNHRGREPGQTGEQEGAGRKRSGNDLGFDSLQGQTDAIDLAGEDGIHGLSRVGGQARMHTEHRLRPSSHRHGAFLLKVL